MLRNHEGKRIQTALSNFPLSAPHLTYSSHVDVWGKGACGGSAKHDSAEDVLRWCVKLERKWVTMWAGYSAHWVTHFTEWPASCWKSSPCKADTDVHVWCINVLLSLLFTCLHHQHHLTALLQHITVAPTTRGLTSALQHRVWVQTAANKTNKQIIKFLNAFLEAAQ